VDAEISRTVPSPNMDIGIRPMTPAAEKRHAPGTEKISRYGRSGCDQRPFWEVASSIPVISPATS
jgi:hypothetical protein